MKWDIEGVVINKKLFPCGASTEVEKTVISSGADNIATFTTNERKPLTSLDITIVPSQEGTGDPSPSNVRPIISYDKVTAKIQKETTKVKEVVSFGKTVYGLTGDCVTGEFEETHYKFSGSDVTSVGRSGASGGLTTFSITLANNNLPSAVVNTCISNQFSRDIASGNEGRMTQSATVIYFVVSTSRLESDTAAGGLAWVQDNNVDFCYELATPTELTTDPVTITTFAGEQTVRFDEKIPFTLKYLTLEGDSCDITKQFLPLFYNKERRSL